MMRVRGLGPIGCAAACLGLAGCGSLSTTTRPVATASRSAATSTQSNPAAIAVALRAGPRRASEFFGPSSAWNTTDLYAPTDVRSAVMIGDAMRAENPVEQPDGRLPKLAESTVHAGLFINTKAWTDAIVQGGPPTKMHCRQIECGDDDNISTLDVPANVSPDPRYDGWFTIISPNGRVAYDLWRARRLGDGAISFQYMRIWNLAGSGSGAPGSPSARGSGLPLFAGLIRPQELQNGQINHALAISVPAPASRNYVRPASTTDGDGATGSLPEGARIRLEAGAVLRPTSPMTREQRRLATALMWTLHTYGAIVVGRAAVPTLYAAREDTSSMLVGNELQSLPLSDFQVVQLPAELQDPANSTQSGAGFTPSPGYGG